MTTSAFFFSGTGNTAWIAARLVSRLGRVYRAGLYDICGDHDFPALLRGADIVLLAFPVYGSSPPIPMRQFVTRYAALLKGKRVVIAETQYFFSGDGAASLGRAVEGCGAKVIAAEHFNMPNNLSDCRVFPVRNGPALRKTLARAGKRADAFAERILYGRPPRRGFSLFSHAVGYFGQRMFWRKGEAEKRKRVKADPARCVGCGACVKGCPVSNFELGGGKAVPLGKCVMCYRCVNLCPRQALTLVGSAPPKIQYKGPKD